ncbi:MAG: TIGR00295 family protein [Candidatus Bathyarchaeota archaeon]|nr:MAG: TIGR00295 family protein [Candidatus Bathyarchaeota archaeon]
MSDLPSFAEALEILHDLGCSDELVRHCKLVSKIGEDIADICKSKGVDVDVDLVVIGGLLHDLGRSETHSIQHGVVGAQLAQKIGLPQSLVLIIERHIGAGIPSEEAVLLGLPERDYIPNSLEERIVAYADKLVCGDRRTTIDSEIYRLSKELGSHHPAIQRLRNLDSEIRSLVEDC